MQRNDEPYSKRKIEINYKRSITITMMDLPCDVTTPKSARKAPKTTQPRHETRGAIQNQQPMVLL